MKATDPQIIREITVQEEDHSVHAFTRNVLTQQTRAAHRMKAASDQRASELLCKVLEDSNSSAHISHVPTSSVRVVMGSSMAISATKAISHVREQTAISPGITITENRMEVISRVRAASSHVRVAMDSHVRVDTDSHVRADTDSHVRVASSHVRVATDSSVRVAMDSHVRVAMDSHVRAAMDSSVRVATSSVAATSSAHRATILTPSTA